MFPDDAYSYRLWMNNHLETWFCLTKQSENYLPSAMVTNYGIENCVILGKLLSK